MCRHKMVGLGTTAFVLKIGISVLASMAFGYFNRGQAKYYANRDHSEAIADFTQAVAINLNNTQARTNSGRTTGAAGF
jgi:hypothetical protein